MRYGKSWISGYATNDSMRKGSQSDPRAVHVNFLLGNSLKMVMDTAYNNPSTTLLVNAFLPGVPMDFLQALGSSPWSFLTFPRGAMTWMVLLEKQFLESGRIHITNT